MSPNQKSSQRSSLRRSVASPTNAGRSNLAEIEDDNDEYEPSDDGEGQGSMSGSSNSGGSSKWTGSSGDGEGPLEDDEQYFNDDDEYEEDNNNYEEEEEDNANQRGLLHIEQALKDIGVMSKELFKKKLKLMNQRKKWAQRYSRYLTRKKYTLLLF
jgi:hypothetical protein